MANLQCVRGDGDAALTAARRAFELANAHPWSYCDLGWALLVAGRVQEAEQQLQRLDEENARTGRNWGYAPILASRLGETDRALEYLERGFDYREPVLIAFARWDGFALLWDDPRADDLIGRIGLVPRRR